MNAAEYLNQVGMIDAKLKVIDANIKRIRMELRCLGDISVSSPAFDGQPRGTRIGDPTGEKASKMADSYSVRRDNLIKNLQDLEHEQIRTRSELWKTRMEVLETIERVYDANDQMSKTYYRLLVLRYIEGVIWEEISQDLHYTVRHTIRLHDEAIKRLEVILNNG